MAKRRGRSCHPLGHLYVTTTAIGRENGGVPVGVRLRQCWITAAVVDQHEQPIQSVEQPIQSVEQPHGPAIDGRRRSTHERGPAIDGRRRSTHEHGPAIDGRRRSTPGSPTTGCCLSFQ